MLGVVRRHAILALLSVYAVWAAGWPRTGVILVSILIIVLSAHAAALWYERRGGHPRRNSGLWRWLRRKRDYRDLNTRYYGDIHAGRYEHGPSDETPLLPDAHASVEDD